ncbi:sulfotransferase family 2 domain-containing protein [Microbulbifer sp. ALW1]|uniref:sulfotransferase family 2 domain-containing protein n=1 Tax=Microbulbifer sp. (strain ALW1) TaxID=1516059 RepID=UPI0013582A96|nr:sulfotransferase family 2 domain-containing protein [Microbulbifer sp. ALW1]
MRVLICGLSKTGTTYLAEKVKRSLEDYLGRVVQEVFEPKSIEITNGGLYYGHKTYQKLSKPEEVVKVLADSGPSSESIIAAQNFFDKKIMIVRDPRDRLISGTFYRWHSGHNPDPEKFHRSLRLTKHKEKNPEDIPFMFLFNQNPIFFCPGKADFGASYRSALRLMDDLDNDWYIIKYEDIVDGNLSGLGEYLGLNIADKVSVSAGRARVARSKSYGNWRTWFTEVDVNYFKPIFKEYMERNGYDFSDWELSKVSELPSKEGSEYMLKIYSANQKRNISLSRIHQKLVPLAQNISKRVSMKVARSDFIYSNFPKVPESKPYFFIHIPKTGGTSFREALMMRVGAINIVEDYRGHVDYRKSLVYEYIDQKNDFDGFFKRFSELRNPWLVGHTDLERYSKLFDSEQIITFVRHPVERIISSYRHKVRTKRLECSFEEFCHTNECQNYQFRKLSGRPLKDIGFVGVTERYQESIRYFNWMTGLDLPVFASNQAPKSADFDIPGDLYAELCQLNSLDFQIYEEANALLDLKLKSIT